MLVKIKDTVTLIFLLLSIFGCAQSYKKILLLFETITISGKFIL